MQNVVLRHSTPPSQGLKFYRRVTTCKLVRFEIQRRTNFGERMAVVGDCGEWIES